MASCKIPKPKDPAAAARAEVVELLFAYVERLRGHFESVVSTFELTPVQAKVLMHLEEPVPMRSVADSLTCDPSNITGVVDRLEERGLVERAADPSDRRVTLLRTTTAGRSMRESVATAVFRDVPGMKGLSRAQVADLRDALAALCKTAPEHALR